MQTYFQSGLGKMIPGIQWSRPEISHLVHDMAKLMGKSNHVAVNVMHRCMEHCVDTPNCGVALRPQGNLDGTKDFKLIISGRSYKRLTFILRTLSKDVSKEKQLNACIP